MTAQQQELTAPFGLPGLWDREPMGLCLFDLPAGNWEGAGIRDQDSESQDEYTGLQG